MVWLLAAVVAVLLGWLILRHPQWLRYLFLVRFPLLFAGLLVALPLLSVWGPLERLLGNLYVVGPLALGGAVLLAALFAWVLMVTIDLVFRYGPLRFALRRPEVSGWLTAVWRWRLYGFLLLTLPTAAALVWASALQPGAGLAPAAAVGAVVAGYAAAVLGLVLAVAFQLAVQDDRREPDHDLLLPAGTPGRGALLALARLLSRAMPGAGALRRLVTGVVEKALALLSRWSRGGHAGEGYRDPDGRWLPGHATAVVFTGLTLAVYVVGYVLFQPARGLLQGFTSLGYVFLILILATWLLSGISFLLDRYRVPILAVVVVLSILGHAMADSDHYWHVEQAGDAVPAAAPWTAGEGPVVMVAASGGGITASLWTARVLAGLQCEVGEELVRSLFVVSSVSGGSAGTLSYVDRFTDGALPTPGELEELVRAAGDNSLDATAWGLAYPDLWRVFGLRPLRLAVDRGWAMETAWRRHLEHRDATLAGWRGEVAAGQLPGVVFNATGAETGRPFRFSTVALPEGMQGEDFFTVLPGRDVTVATAARLSATFPWVSPLARPLDDDRADLPWDLHLGDGGYYDNFGVVTVVEWLQAQLDGRAPGLEELRRRGLLIVQIRASADEEDRPPPLGSWTAASAGPLLTLLGVRTAGQELRNRFELRQTLKLLRDREVPVEVALFTQRADAPLSWKLTRRQKEEILSGWSDADNRRALERVQTLFSGPRQCGARFESPGS